MYHTQSSKLANRSMLAIALITALVFVLTAHTKNTVKFENRAIICLTYDDGLETQLTTAIPQLNAAGLKATFFLNSIHGSSQSDVIGQTPEAVLGWTNAAKNGHELANHTLFHPCPEKLGWSTTVSIDHYSIDQIVKEISTQNSLLSLLDPARKQRAFAFPCNNTLIGNTDYAKIIKDKGLVTFGRTGGDSSSIITDFKTLDNMKVPSWHVWTGTTLEQLISFAQKVKTKHGMGVYQIHGVGGQIFGITAETHKAFLGYLQSHRDEYWITTFTEAMEYVSKKK